MDALQASSPFPPLDVHTCLLLARQPHALQQLSKCVRERDGGQVEHKENSHVTGFDEIKKKQFIFRKDKDESLACADF